MRRLARFLLYGGVVAAVVGFSKAHAVAKGYSWSGSFRFSWSFAYMGLLMVAAFAVGLPDQRRKRREAYIGAVQASVAAAVGVSLLQLAVGDALLPRFVVFGAATALAPWFVVCARLAALGASWGEDRDRVLVVAPPDEVTHLLHDLGHAPEQEAAIVATLTPAEASSQTGRVALLDRAREAAASIVVLCRVAQDDESIVAQAALLHETGVRVRTLSLFYEEWLGKLPISELERVSLLFDIGEVHRERYGRMKRVFDVILATAGLGVLAVAVPFVLIGDLCANRGPLLYRQDRVGKGGSRFQILKFRTMRPAAGGALANEWTSVDDPRVTRFGRFLRTTHLDELPQVLNILRGDLSIVGPRPEQPHYVEELSGKLAFYDLRHLVRPGLTGWAQVKYGYAGDESDALEKLQYEFFYLRRQGLAFDLRIVGRTIRSVSGRRGR